MVRVVSIGVGVIIGGTIGALACVAAYRSLVKIADVAVSCIIGSLTYLLVAWLAGLDGSPAEPAVAGSVAATVVVFVSLPRSHRRRAAERLLAKAREGLFEIEPHSWSRDEFHKR